MLSGKSVRAKRLVAGISGQSVCEVAGISRATLSEIERGYTEAAVGVLQRVDSAIDQIILTKQQLAKLAMDAGLELAGVRF